MSDPIKKMLQDINEELAQITDVQKREKERAKVQKMLEHYEGEDKIVPMSKNLKRSRLENAALKSYSTGYTGLDKMLKEFRDTELIVLTGPTKNGKTTFAMSLTKNMIEQGIVPGWFSFEMGDEEFAEKIGERVMDRIYTPQKLVSNDLKWLEQRIVEAIAKYNVNIFFIDHLHFMTPRSGRDNLSSRIGEAVQRIKEMAVKWRVVIVLIAHTTKIKPTEDPTIASLRDSSFIGQDANTVMYVKRVGDEMHYTDQLELFVIANRRTGNNGKIDLIYDSEELYLQEVHDG